jgi:hypothetical protein
VGGLKTSLEQPSLLQAFPDCVVFLDRDRSYEKAREELKSMNVPSIGLVSPTSKNYYDFRVVANINSIKVKSLFFNLVTKANYAE